jgi:opacity protein-like surface antigen
MRKRGAMLQILTILLVVFTSSWVYALNEVGDTQQWDLRVTPYLWTADLEGDATFRGRTGSIEASFSDIMDNFDIGFMGRVEAWKNGWGVTLDGLYLDLGTEFKTSRGKADVDIKETFLDFGIGRRVLDVPVGQDNSQNLSFDLLGGGRYVHIEGTVDIVPSGPLGDILGIGGSYEGKIDYVEPFVGGRIRWDMNDKFAIVARGDVGGFSVGSASDLTWNLVAGIDYQLSKNMNFVAGYRILDIDFEENSGSNEYGLDVQMKGPVFGFSMRF